MKRNVKRASSLKDLMTGGRGGGVQIEIFKRNVKASSLKDLMTGGGGVQIEFFQTFGCMDGVLARNSAPVLPTPDSEGGLTSLKLINNFI